MDIKLACLLLISVATLNNLSANDKKSHYNQFVNDYSNLFGEKPGNVWNSNKADWCGGVACDSGEDCSSQPTQCRTCSACGPE